MVFFWASALALSVLLYVLLDGLDLGMGMLFGFARHERRRAAMMHSIEPVWDGNETWLIVAGVVLWGAFPPVYAALLSAFYLPVMLMLAGLIFRGIAFEFRVRARRTRWMWDLGFCCGSFIAAFMQGLMVGALVKGLPLSQGAYAGGEFTWLSPFALLCGGGLCLGYCLLGACWWVGKSRDDVRDDAYRLIPRLSVGLVLVLLFVFIYALYDNLRVLGRWFERPVLFAFPVIAVIAACLLNVSVRRHWRQVPFYMASLAFAAAFGTFAISFWPYIIPFSLTIEEAAAPRAALAFMFWGEGLFVLPLMLLYTIISYRVFRGKVELVEEDS